MSQLQCVACPKLIARKTPAAAYSAYPTNCIVRAIRILPTVTRFGGLGHVPEVTIQRHATRKVPAPQVGAKFVHHVRGQRPRVRLACVPQGGREVLLHQLISNGLLRSQVTVRAIAQADEATE